MSGSLLTAVEVWMPLTPISTEWPWRADGHFSPARQASVKSLLCPCDRPLSSQLMFQAEEFLAEGPALLNSGFLSFCSPDIDVHKEHWDPLLPLKEPDAVSSVWSSRKHKAS